MQQRLEEARTIVGECFDHGISPLETAQELYARHLHYEDAAQALREKGVVVNIETLMPGIKQLVFQPEDSGGFVDPDQNHAVTWWEIIGAPEVTAERPRMKYPQSDPKHVSADSVWWVNADTPVIGIKVDGTTYPPVEISWGTLAALTPFRVLVEDPLWGWLSVEVDPLRIQKRRDE